MSQFQERHVEDRTTARERGSRLLAIGAQPLVRPPGAVITVILWMVVLVNWLLTSAASMEAALPLHTPLGALGMLAFFASDLLDTDGVWSRTVLRTLGIGLVVAALVILFSGEG